MLTVYSWILTHTSQWTMNIFELVNCFKINLQMQADCIHNAYMHTQLIVCADIVGCNQSHYFCW